MTLDLSALLGLKERKPPPSKPEWKPLDLTALHPGTYVAADQSLDGFGLVVLEVFGQRLPPAVHLAQKIKVGPTADASGWEDILRRTATLGARLTLYIDTWVRATDWGEMRAVHEAPPIGGGKFVNPEISLITAREFRRACVGLPMLPMVRRQDHARLICGLPNAPKPLHHKALKKLYPDIRGTELVTNEAHRDALSVGLYAAWRGI